MCRCNKNTLIVFKKKNIVEISDLKRIEIKARRGYSGIKDFHVVAFNPWKELLFQTRNLCLSSSTSPAAELKT